MGFARFAAWRSEASGLETGNTGTGPGFVWCSLGLLLDRCLSEAAATRIKPTLQGILQIQLCCVVPFRHLSVDYKLQTTIHA